MKKYNILIADDHSIVANGIINLLKNDLNFKQIITVDNAKSVDKMLEGDQFDLLITDISMPNSNHLNYLVQIRKNNPNQKILIFSMHDEIQYIYKVISLDLNGYIGKDVSDEELVTGINEVLIGNKFFSKNIMQTLTTQMSVKATQTSLLKNVSLTKREKEIIILIKLGYMNKEIGLQLFLSNKTVSVHRYNIMQKLKVKNLVDLLKVCSELGI